MRRVPHALICGSLLVLTSCGWGAQSDDQGGKLPSAPMGVTAAAGSATSVHVMWNRASGDPEVTEYVVYRGMTKVKAVPGTDHMVDITRLKPSTTYVFNVRALNADGNPGPPSKQVRATTPAAVAADEKAPTSPGRPSGKTVGSGSVQLSWEKSTDDRGVASYDIYQGASKIHSVGGGQTATVVTGLRAGTGYSFTVKARDAADNVSAASDAVRLTTAPGSDSGKGTAPTDFRATTHLADGAYYLDLSWIPPDVDGVITEYQIHLDGEAATSLVWGGTAPSKEATYSFYVGRDADVTHRVRMRAKLPDGTWGGYSPERTVTTGAEG
ncbi:fibronectin type III domain-containing protein [Streptomyces sp. NBC_00620]|uniref:fibronectin type III domain-containing protein n=1 Tax=Streptomyces sp. NBC_00620 TaxID=2903666 RepID=UPI0022503A3E|nr:fibronectin type III domain-containing protein [Streptomyces sp. NBC_00620]MCX4977005.1 fibronectin type III domain-containing protein [Streptomyces sp. NBC_00620]